MYSRLLSFRPPFLAFVRGVRRARVMTMSSAFLEVLLRGALLGQCGHKPTSKTSLEGSVHV
jgi:hypothetical protein